MTAHHDAAATVELVREVARGLVLIGGCVVLGLMSRAVVWRPRWWPWR